MSFNLAAGVHFEWQSLDMFETTAGVGQLSIVTTPLITDLAYSHVLKIAGNATQGGVLYPQWGDTISSTSPGSNTFPIWHGYLRWTDVLPDAEYEFLTFTESASIANNLGGLSFILETDGDIRVRDADDVTIATITKATSGLTNDTWHRFEVRYRLSTSLGELKVWIDGVEVATATEYPFGSTFVRYVQMQGPLAGDGDMFFAGAVTYTTTTSDADRIDDDFEWIGPYQVVTTHDETSDTDVGAGNATGDALDGFTIGWGDTGTTPLSGTDVAVYNSNKDGGVKLDTGSRQGPDGDSRIDGDSNIIGMEALFWAKRGNGGATTWAFIAGNVVDKYDAAEQFTDPIVTASYKMFHVVSTDAGAVPLSTQDGLLALAFTGAKDLEVASMAMFLLHIPGAGGAQTDKSISFAVVTGMALTKFPIRPKAISFAMATGIGRSLITSKPFGVNFTTGMGVAKKTQKTFTVGFATAMALTTARVITKAISFGMSTAMGLTKIISKPFSVAFSTSMTLAKETRRTFTVAFSTAMALAKTTFPITKAVAFVTTMVTSPATLFQKALAFAMVTGMGLVKQTKKAFSVTFSTGMGIAREVRKTLAVTFTTAFALARKTSALKTVSFVTGMALTAGFTVSRLFNIAFVTTMTLSKTTRKTFSVTFASAMTLARSISVTKTVEFVTSMTLATTLNAAKSLSFGLVTSMVQSAVRVTTKAISVAFVTAMSTVTDFTAGSGVFGRIIWLLRRRRR